MDENQGPARTEIASRAYELYVERGCHDGHALRDWLDAEAELTGAIPPPGEEPIRPSAPDEVTEASWESFPASDAPGWRSGTTDTRQA
jgi:hypothetical protein